MKNRFVLLSLLTFGILFFSCSDDDNSAGSSSVGNLVGTWSMDLTSSIGSFYDDEDAYTFFQFQKDGTYIIVDQSGEDLEISFGTYKHRSANKIVVTVDEEDTDAEYRISDNKLYLSLPVGGILTTFVLTHVDDNVMDHYFTKHNLKDYLKQNEVNLDQYKVNIDQYKVNMDQYKVSIDKYKVNLTQNTVSGLSCPDNKHPHAIDMGDAGKWACCNVGASSPAEFGGYYAWGETEEKDYYDYSTYKFYEKTTKSFKSLGDDIAGTFYDVAHVKWGGKWKMPSLERIELLLDNCSSEWCKYNLYGEANIENCYNINGKIYRIENADGFFLINDMVYKFDNVDDFKNYYFINGKTYKIDNINGYYLINDKIYKLDNVSNYYTVDGKIYNIKNSYGYYVKGNDLYIIPSGEVTGLEYFSAENVQTSGSLNDQAVSNIAVSFNNKKLTGTVSGRMFTSKGGNKIFLPAAGGRWYDYTGDVGYDGYYWSSTQDPNYSDGACSLHFSGGFAGTSSNYRPNGLSVRSVTD